MTQPRMDNGDWMMRPQRNAYEEAVRRAYQQAAQQRNYNPLSGPFGPYPPGAYDPPIAGEPEPEDTTGLKLLDEFLSKRRSERDGEQRQRSEGGGSGKRDDAGEGDGGAAGEPGADDKRRSEPEDE